MWLWLRSVALPSDYPRCKTRNCWCSVDTHFWDGATSMSLTYFYSKPATNFSLDWCDYATLWLPNRSDENHWSSIDAHLRDILTVIRRSLNLHKIHTVIIYTQYTMWMYNHLRPQALRHLTFWATTIHVICRINVVAPSQFSAFRPQFRVYGSTSQFWTYRARNTELSSSSLFSSISMTYHKQFSKPRPCAAVLIGVVCRWLHGLMQHDGCHSSGFTLNTDCTSHDSYDTADLNFFFLNFVSISGFAF